jgi:hypothetical protein
MHFDDIPEDFPSSISIVSEKMTVLKLRCKTYRPWNQGVIFSAISAAAL